MTKKYIEKIFLILIMIFSILSSYITMPVFAATTVTKVIFSTSHDGFDKSSAYLEIQGTELGTADIKIRDLDEKLFEPSDIEFQTETLITINFTAEEAKNIAGELIVGGVSVDLDIKEFATLSSASKRAINYNPKEESLTIYGNNLDKIKTNLPGDTNLITASYGNQQTQKFYNNMILPNSSSQITIVKPTPGDKGYQNIIFEREVAATAFQPIRKVTYKYNNCFRLVEDIGLTDLKMYPNTGAIGDEIYFTSNGLNEKLDTYGVYLVKELNNEDEFIDDNKCLNISIATDIDGSLEDKLTVKVPENDTFKIGTYYVILVKEISGQIVAEQIVKKVDGVTNDKFTVIGASYKPTIDQISPTEGPDTRQNVFITGKNLITLNIPTLESDNQFVASGLLDDTILHLDYNDGKYDSKDVSISRDIKIQIGKVTTFTKTGTGPGAVFNITQGVPDQIVVKTATIDDAAVNPQKDVQVEITTTVTEIGIPSPETYVFSQNIILPEGYTFIPSTITPEINSILPEKIQVTESGIYNKLKKETLISIKGSNFLVDKVVVDGEVIIKKPTVIFKKDDTNLLFTNYQLGFFPNETVSYGGGNTVTGVIRYKETEESAVSNLLLNGGIPIKLDMIVLDESGKEVDGTDGNDVGSNILIRISNEALIKDIGQKHIQVINPRRGSDLDGAYAIKSDMIEIVSTNDNPVIESVEPHVVTVEGGEEIKITGSNFKEGLTLLLDGEEISNFTKTGDVLGQSSIITFTAPSGREGTTQLAVVNSTGEIDVRDFVYVKAFNSDPEFTSFSPSKGTGGTLVIANGDNFLKPDPSVENTSGVNGLRLIGTRVFVDGNDVNNYNYDLEDNILFKDYESPLSNYKLIKNSSDKAVFSEFKNNVMVRKNGVAENVSLFSLGNDKDGNPTITNYEDERYSFVYNGVLLDSYTVYDIEGNNLGNANIVVVGNDTNISFTGASFTATMDNNLISKKKDQDGNFYVDTADYADSIILNKWTTLAPLLPVEGEYYTLSKNFDNEVIFTNGSDINYLITLDDSDNFVAKEGTRPNLDVEIYQDSIVIDNVTYKYLTPYIVSNEISTKNRIIGDKTNIIAKKQLSFIVPSLKTGTGYKDVLIVNPDTKNVSKIGNEGFYYITQPQSNPIISEINPEKGSISGGYVIKISGSGFEDDMKVFIDSVFVPTSDTFVAIDGSYVVVKVPKCIKDLQEDFEIDRFKVPVVVLNEDGGSDYLEEGFMYVVPISNPRIDSVVVDEGSSNGGEIVRISGYDFRFAESYVDSVGGAEYNLGDKFEDIYRNNLWDDLLADVVNPGALEEVDFSENPFYSKYYKSDILPRIYFGEKEGKIVEFENGFVKVISPPHDEEAVDLYLVNNDQGISNIIKYKYEASSPKITEISPNKGRKWGQELKNIYGESFYRTELFGYSGNVSDTISKLPDVSAIVRFGDIDNLSLGINDPNYGGINSGSAEVNLEGNLKVQYSDSTDSIKMFVEENGKFYSKNFTGYDNSEVYLPMEMLQNNDGASPIYYVPEGYEDHNGTVYKNVVFEYIKVSIKDRRLLVERGYAPKVSYETSNRIVATSPSYHTIDPVNLYVKNSDGGVAKSIFTYTNPDSLPKILKINPSLYSENIDPDDANNTIKTYDVEGSIQGGIEIEIIGLDFRDSAKVYIGSSEAEVVDTSTTLIDGVTYDVIIAKIPVATTNDIDMRYPIIVENTDSGMANSTTIDNLIGPNYLTQTLRYYFVYRKPLSGPTITSIEPIETSVFGGNEVVITGRDFRDDATVIIGSRGGVPIYNGVITERGTILTITTPQDLTIGMKTIQVINKDFGTFSLENGLKVVSYPTVDDEILSEDKESSMNVVSVEGGERITITGTGFMEGAKVIFGGVRKEKSEENSEGEEGFFKDDKYYIVSEGYLCKDVTFVNERTLIVTTPQITEEETFAITVINSDGGLSDDNSSISYSEPIPSRPLGLKATVIDNRYIKLYDYVSTGVEYYEVYYYLGSKDTSQLYNENYRDLGYLGTTIFEPYKITRIPNFENRKMNDKLYFVLKAVNKFGVSNWSNFAVLSYNQLKDIENLGPEDYDGDIGVAEGKEYDYKSDKNKSVIRISEKKLGEKVLIDLYGREFNNPAKRLITIPEEMVKKSSSIILVNYLDSKLQFSPLALNTEEFRELEFYDKAYGEIETSTSGDKDTSMKKQSIPRGKKAVSNIFTLRARVLNNEESKDINSFSTPIDIQLLYNDTYISEDQENELIVYRFDKDLNRWEIISSRIDKDNNFATARVNKTGSYAVFYSK